jgi:hypothetical protein
MQWDKEVIVRVEGIGSIPNNLQCNMFILSRCFILSHISHRLTHHNRSRKHHHQRMLQHSLKIFLQIKPKFLRGGGNINVVKVRLRRNQFRMMERTTANLTQTQT